VTNLVMLVSSLSLYGQTVVLQGLVKKLKRKDVCCVYNSHYWLLTKNY